MGTFLAMDHFSTSFAFRGIQYCNLILKKINYYS